jgi:hypothetical protein
MASYITDIWSCVIDCGLLTTNIRVLTKLRGHYATNRKVAGSSPDEVDFSNLPNPSNRTVALGSTQPLAEMSTRNPPGG